MSDELVKQWDEYVESMGSVMGDVEHMTQQMRDRIEQLIAERDSLLAGHRTLNIVGARLETRIKKLIAEREMAANWWKEAVELTQQARLQYSEEKARAEKAEAERDRLREALEKIAQWSEAYPTEVFPEPDFAQAAAALASSGISIDVISASNMRHATKGVGKIARAALKGETP